jgi:hypothetical protein
MLVSKGFWDLSFLSSIACADRDDEYSTFRSESEIRLSESLDGFYVCQLKSTKTNRDCGLIFEHCHSG